MRQGRIQRSLGVIYMILDNEIVKNDLEYIASVPFIDWHRLKGTAFFVTGATGVIGSSLVKALLYADFLFNLNLSIAVLVRDLYKAKELFSSLNNDRIIFIEGSIENLPHINISFDFIIHAANPTSSSFFALNPVETIKTSVLGCMNILEFAKSSKPKSLVFLSSMEVYGAPETDDKISEDYQCNINLASPRSSYPESKRLSESLCTAYLHEYGIPARIIRLTQTFGPGVRYNDQRVFAQFARCAVDGLDIKLVTKGKTKRSYLYTADAITAILAVLLNGKDGEAYNAANEETYCSIYEMANLVLSLSTKKRRVIIPEAEDDSGIYAPTLKMNLDTTKLRALGWTPNTSLLDMYRNMIACF